MNGKDSMTRTRRALFVLLVGGALIAGAVACAEEEPAADTPAAAEETTTEKAEKGDDDGNENEAASDYALGIAAWATLYQELFNLDSQARAAGREQSVQQVGEAKPPLGLRGDWEVFGSAGPGWRAASRAPQRPPQARAACDHYDEEAAALGEEGTRTLNAALIRRSATHMNLGAKAIISANKQMQAIIQ